jgi:Glycosyltransferase family 87
MPPAPRSRLRSVLMGFALVAALAVICWKGSQLFTDPTVLPPDDFVEYWAAGRLNAQGQNPYEGALLLPLEREAGRDTDEAVMMWNPPWTLSLAMPVGLLPARIAQLLWLAVSLGLVLACSDRLWLVYGGQVSRRWVAWLLALTFVPTLFVLQAGQIGPFILLGIAAFLIAERVGLPWLAGACGVLMAIKPHLVYLFWIALAGWSLSRPMPSRWKLIAGGLIVGLIATGFPLIANSQVLGQYWEAMTHRTPEQWKSPTIGSYLREALGETQFGLQFAPTLLGLAWLAADSWRSRKRKWDWTERMPLLLLVSFVTASYGAWPFDLVILLPAVIHVGAGLASTRDSRKSILAFAVYAAVNLAALISNLMHLKSDTFVWMAPCLLAAYVLLRPRSAT